MLRFLETVRRIVRDSGQPAGPLVTGVLLRTFDKGLSIAPFFLAYLGLEAAFLGGKAEILWAALWLVGILAAQMACSVLGQRAGFLGGYDLMLGYRARVAEQVGRLPLGCLQQWQVGQLASVVTEDVKRVEDIFTHVVGELLSNVTAPLLFLIGLAWLDWRLTLALMLTLPVAVLGLNAASGFFLVQGRSKQGLLHDTSGLIVEFLGGLKTLRLFNRTENWLDRLERQFAAIRRASLGVEAWGGGSVQFYRLCLEGGLVSLVLAASWLDQVPPLSWLLFVLLAGRLLEPLLEAAAYLTQLRGMVLGEKRIRALLEEPLLPEGNGTLSGSGEITFDAVRFRYEDQWVLRDVSFQIAPGSMTAIVGPSGAGKSTVLHLVARFFDPQAGCIRIGGQDIRAVTTEDLYRHLGFVFQDVQLFDGTILENLLIGKPDASADEIAEACRAAYCDGFIARLPDGLETRVGENGQLLSGGERQRLSIARAVLKDAPILLLDEATASVDPEAQYEIQQALSRLAHGRTVLVVAHRLHTIRHADQILVLDQGRVAERGRHEVLLAAGGLYAALWADQFR